MPNINPRVKVAIDPLVKVQPGEEPEKAPPKPVVKKDAEKPKAPKREEPKKKDEGKRSVYYTPTPKGKRKGKR